MKRIIAWLFFIAICTYYYKADITETASGIPCMFKYVSGYSCAGCGTQRALHSLLHFEFQKAFYYNAIFVIFFPYFIYLLYVFIESYVVKRKVSDNFFLQNKFVIAFVILMISFAIFRNLPFDFCRLFQA